MTLLYAVLGIFLFVELYSVGIYFLALNYGLPNPLKVFLPFYCFTYARKLSGPFHVMTIPVNKMAATIIFVTVAAVLALSYALWGNQNLPATSGESLWQIMWIVIGLCIFVAWYTIVSSSIKIFRRFNVERRKLYCILSLFMLTIPFLFLSIRKNSFRSDAEMY